MSARLCGSTLMLPTHSAPKYVRCVLAPEHEQLCRGVMSDVAEFRAPQGMVEGSSTVKVMLTWKAPS